MPIIEIEHLTKEYQLGTLTGFKDSLLGKLPEVGAGIDPEVDGIDFLCETRC